MRAVIRQPVGVLHLIDTLEIGGAERVAVNLVNGLSRDRYAPHLCTTRRQGPLASQVARDVGQIHLARRHRFDVLAMAKLIPYVREHRIQIVHAHSSSVFLGSVLSRCVPTLRLVWHDHWGGASRPSLPYRLVRRRIRAAIAVNERLAEWDRAVLGIARERVRYIPNFAVLAPPSGVAPALPGTSGSRIVCVANVLPRKDQRSLVRAMVDVIEAVPDAQLLLVGGLPDENYAALLRADMMEMGLRERVSLMGVRGDVGDILRATDVAVLNSRSEAFPVALVEYGLAGLPVITTDVGQCAAIVDEGAAGLLVPVGDPTVLAKALIRLLGSPTLRAELGTLLHQRVEQQFGAERILSQIEAVYDGVLAEFAG